MTEQELLNAAKAGNIGAIEDYADCLIEKKNWSEALDWLRKGAEAGSQYCIIKNAYLTSIFAVASYPIMPNAASALLRDLEQAEKWVLSVKETEELSDEDVLNGADGLYSSMALCHYCIAVGTKNPTDYKAVIKRYRMIDAIPASRVTYGYIRALDELGMYSDAVEPLKLLLDHPDETSTDFSLKTACTRLCKAYFEGIGVSPDYEKAYEYAKKIKEYDPTSDLVDSFENGNARKAFNTKHSNATHNSTSPASNTSSGGCYVATAVYGSYDCPQVWTLRRFRDDVLASSFAGRLFIRTYYAISPTLVKWFGHCAWFRNLWKPTLDRMVAKLNANGTEDTPYQDRTW